MTDTIGQRIKLARETAGMKQSDLADKAKTQWQQVSRWERDQSTPRAKSVKALCEALSLSPRWLLSGEGPMYASPLDAYANSPIPGADGAAEAHEGYTAQDGRASIDVALLQRAIQEALQAAPGELPERLAQAISDAYHTAMRTRRLDKVGELVRTFLS